MYELHVNPITSSKWDGSKVKDFESESNEASVERVPTTEVKE